MERIRSYHAEQRHTVYLSVSRPATASRGARQHIICSYNAQEREQRGTGLRASRAKIVITKDTRCNMFVLLQESTVGWVVVHGCLDHNPRHSTTPPPALTDGDKRCTYFKNRKMPDQLLATVTPAILRIAKTVPAIHAHLEHEAQALNITVKFTYQDIANHFAITAAERAYDCTGLIEEPRAANRC